MWRLATAFFVGALFCLVAPQGEPEAATVYGSIVALTCPSPVTYFAETSASLNSLTQIIAGSASKNIYVCEVTLTAPNNEVNFVEGTGTNCGTGGQMLGQTTGSNTTAAKGFIFDNATAPGVGFTKAGLFGQTATAGDALCVIAAAATQVTISFYYSQQ